MIRVAGQIAADPDRNPRKAPTSGFDQVPDGRSARRDQVTDPFIAAVGGHRVLGQIIGSDRDKVHQPGEIGCSQRGRRNFDHDPERQRRRVSQLGPYLLEQFPGPAHLRRLADHRQQDPDRDLPGGQQDPPELGSQQLWLTTYGADAALTQHRVRLSPGRDES